MLVPIHLNFVSFTKLTNKSVERFMKSTSDLCHLCMFLGQLFVFEFCKVLSNMYMYMLYHLDRRFYIVERTTKYMNNCYHSMYAKTYLI